MSIGNITHFHLGKRASCHHTSPIKEIYGLCQEGCEGEVAHILCNFRGRKLDRSRGSQCGLVSSIETSWRRIEIPPTSRNALLPLPSLSPLTARRPGRSALLSPSNSSRPTDRVRGGVSARACQGQLTSVTFSAIHWLFADSGGAMMDYPARAATRLRRPGVGWARGGSIRASGGEMAATSGRYVLHQDESLKIIATRYCVGELRRRRKGRAADSAPRTKDGRLTGIRRSAAPSPLVVLSAPSPSFPTAANAYSDERQSK